MIPVALWLVIWALGDETSGSIPTRTDFGHDLLKIGSDLGVSGSGFRCSGTYCTGNCLV